MITFDNPYYQIWKAGYDAGYVKGAEDMRELAADKLNINADRIALRKDLAAEREISDKLVVALKDIPENSTCKFANHIVSDALAEVVAIRAKQGEQG